MGPLVGWLVGGGLDGGANIWRVDLGLQGFYDFMILYVPEQEREENASRITT